MAETADPTLALQQWMRQGMQLQSARRWPEAESVFRRILAVRSDIPEVHFNLGMALKEQRRWEEAVAAFVAAVTLRPGSNVYANLGDALREMRRPAQAIGAYRRALDLNPNLANVWNNLGGMLWEIERPAEAIEAFRQALKLQPDCADAYNNLGIVFKETKCPIEAMEAFRQAVALRPSFAEAWTNLGCVLYGEKRPTEAMEVFRRILDLRPDHAPAWSNLAGALRDAGQLDAALACVDRGIAIHPDDAVAQGQRLTTLYFHPEYDDAAIFREARKWNDRFARPLAGEIPIHDNDPSPQRRLRIGYVSQGFGLHCESLFTLPLLSHHDHKEFEIFCYSSVAHPDLVTARLQPHADAWRDIFRMTDAAAAQQVRQDRIDILVDLSLHTACNRLGVFARKPAPIQVTWLGYPGTTGMDTIDYRLTDPRLDPVDFSTQEPYYAERSIRLPDSFWCYDPVGMGKTDLPDTGPLPALAAGHVTFGCLNNFCKVSDRTLDLWAGAMAAVPNARLLLTAPSGPHRDRVGKKLGVPPDRVEFVSFQPWGQYLETYHRIDLCLDTLPFNGGTTSLDSLWMGVPVVTRVGATVVGRAGLSHLHNLGLTELVAHSDGEFVQRAAELAGNLDRLGQLRATLRRRMEQSPLMDAPRFARNIEGAYRRMWQAWCRARSQ